MRKALGNARRAGAREEREKRARERERERKRVESEEVCKGW